MRSFTQIINKPGTGTAKFASDTSNKCAACTWMDGWMEKFHAILKQKMEDSIVLFFTCIEKKKTWKQEVLSINIW